jgi:uncharacterized protein YggE
MSMTSASPLLASLLAVVAGLAALPAAAHDREPQRTISLSATGAVKTAPDKVDIATGVTSEAPTAREALDKNTQSMTAVVEALKAEGIETRDIQTANFTVSPVFEQRNDGKPFEPKIVGYRVINQVQITVRDTAKLGAILDKVVTLGANTIDSIAFGVTEPETLKNDARKLAVKNATAKAKLYAEAAGVELGEIRSISEEEQGGPIPRFAAPVAMEMSKDVPIEGGTTTVEVRVNMVWELK